MYGNSKLFSFHHDILCIDICLHLESWVLLFVNKGKGLVNTVEPV